MIRDILEATKLNLEGELSREERAIGELLMYRMLETLREYRGMTETRIPYIIWFAEYQRDRAVDSYHLGKHRDDEEVLEWEW